MAVEALRRARPSVWRGNLQEQLHSKDAALVRAPIPSCGFVTLALKGRQEAGTRTPVLFALAGRGEGALSSRVAPAVSGSRIRSSWPAPGHGLAALSRRRAHPGGAGGGAGGLRMEAARKQRCEGAMALLLRYRAEAGSV